MNLKIEYNLLQIDNSISDNKIKLFGKILDTKQKKTSNQKIILKGNSANVNVFPVELDLVTFIIIKSEGFLNVLMRDCKPQYNLGTINCISGSNIIKGVGTKWVSNVRFGDIIYINTGKEGIWEPNIVKFVNSDSEIKLK